MNREEYERVKGYDYFQYCDYLQNKYGIGKADYMTKSYNRNPKCSRGKEGLYAHHKMEWKEQNLSSKVVAKYYPFEYQTAENIVYCDLLEHLYLHILITEEWTYSGGMAIFMIPELNDIFSGFEGTKEWQKVCFGKVIKDKDVYMLLLKRIKDRNEHCIRYTSYYEKFGVWKSSYNTELYEEIEKL